MCASQSVHTHTVFTTVYTLPLLGLVSTEQPGTLAGREVRPRQLLNHLPPRFPFLFFCPSLLCDGPLAFSRLLKRDYSCTCRSPFAASPPRPQLQTPVTEQDAHFVSRVCPKIVSICIFGNGNVCLINLCVRGTQREL